MLRLCYETVAVTADQIVFLFLGIGLFAFNHPYEKMGVGLAITTVLNLNFARFLNIVIVTSLVNWSRTENTKIPPKMQFIMWLSGLRGAMAYALALKCAVDLEIGPVILIDTLIYAFVTILGVSSILNPLLNKLDVKRKRAVEGQEVPELALGDDENAPMSYAKYFKLKVSAFNQNYIAPIFVK